MRTTEPSPQETGAIYSPTMGAFLKGEAVLADVYGLRRRDLYEIARRGTMLLRAGRLKEARTVFESLTALDPHVADFHSALGVVLMQRGELWPARREFDRALALDVGDAVARVNRAEVQIELGELDGALRDLDMVQTNAPGSAAAERAKALESRLTVASGLAEPNRNPG